MAYEKLKSENYTNLGGINTKASPYVTGLTEFLKISNFDFTQPGSLTQRPGTELWSGTTLTGRLTSVYEFERLNGLSQMILTANTNAYSQVKGSPPVSFKSGLADGLLFDFVTFVDRMFAANGTDLFRYDGTNAYNFSLPPGITTNFGVTAAVGGSMTAGVTGIFVSSYGYINERGYRGPIAPGITLTLNGVTFNSITYVGMTTPVGFGVSSMAIYRSSAGGVDLYRTTSIAPGTSYADLGNALTTDLFNNYLQFTNIPRFMEIVNNQMFCGGFSNMLSTITWSDIGEPEGSEITWRNEIRTNDGDKLKGIKSFQGGGLVFKERSFTKFFANSPTDVSFEEVSDQYGLLSNRAIAEYDSTLLFLDRKGIVKYDGTSPKIVSDRVEPTFLAMNVDSASDNACAAHMRLRNEIWFAIPINGATMNNCIVIYDYVANAWATWFGLNVSSLAYARGGTSMQRPFYSDYVGAIHNFGASLPADNGAGFTCLFQTRFNNDLGDSVTKLYRQLYLNALPGSGATVGVTVSLFADYGASAALSQPMYLNPFQTRIDFGISAKSMSLELSSLSATHAIKIPGYTFKYRFLRNS